MPIVVPVLMTAVWVSRYWHSAEFGLYEDDVPRVIPAMEGSWSQVSRILWNILSGFEGQGRPLHPVFIRFFSYIGSKLGLLQGAYWVAWAIVSTNAILLYLLLRRVSGWPILALSGALAYCLYPADTTQTMLTMAFGGQTSIILFLVAALLYFSRWRPVSYLVALGSLFCYETVFPVFLAIPLLEKDWDRKLLRRLVPHGLMIGGAIVVMAMIRRMIGESYLASLDTTTVLTRPFAQMVIGPATSFSMLFYRPWKSLSNGVPPHWEILTVAFVCLVFLLAFVEQRSREQGREPVTLHRIGQLGATGLAMLVLAYPLTFTVDAAIVDGRDTRVHLAAALGIAVLWGALCTFGLFVARRWWCRGPLVAALALLMTGLFAFGFVIQRDYVRAWSYQRSFWSDLVELCPDIGLNSIILVEQDKLRRVRQISPWGWYMPFTVAKMYRIPGPVSRQPLVYLLREDWRKIVAESGNLLDGANLMGWHLSKRDAPVFILVEWQHGSLHRVEGPVTVGEYEFELRPMVSRGRPEYEERLLGRMMLQPADDRVDYLW